MPRVSREAKARSHTKIVKVAAREFRKKGIEATGLADIMAAAGMTHGGFYRHFASKDQLAAAAILRGFDEHLKKLEAAMSKGDREAAVLEYIDRYLSDRHVDNPGHGCPIVSLAAEAARGPEAERRAIGEGIDRIVTCLADALNDNANDADVARRKAAGLLAVLAGTVTLMRAAGSNELRDLARSAGRHMADQVLHS